MSAAKPITSGTSKTNPSLAPHLEGKETKANPLTQIAVSALSRDMANRMGPIVGDPNASAAKKMEYIQKALNLEEFQLKETSRPKPKLQLSLSEKTLLNRMLRDCVFEQGLTLLDLWGLEVYNHMKALARIITPKDMAALKENLQIFCKTFARKAVESSAKNAEEYIKKWVNQLAELKNDLQIVASSIPNAFKEKQQAFAALIDRLSLGITLLRNNNMQKLRSNVDLFFTETVKPDTANPEKTLQGLITYTKFLSEGFPVVCKVQPPQLDLTIFSKIHQHLTNILEAADKQTAMKALKRDLHVWFSKFPANDEDLKDANMRAAAGKINYKVYCAKYGIKYEKEPTEIEFCQSLFVNYLQNSFLNARVDFCLNLVDAQYMTPLFPDTYASTYLGFRRLYMNVSTINQIVLEKKPASAPVHPAFPGLLASAQKKEISQLLDTIHADTAALTRAAFPPRKFFETAHLILDQKQCIIFDEELIFIEGFEPLLKLFEKLPPQLNELRLKHLKLIEAFLKTLDLKELAKNRDQWIDFFQKACLNATIDFCRLNMIVKDLQACAELDTVNGEELFLDEYVDYVLLDGIEGLIDHLIKPAHPMREEPEGRPEKPRPVTIRISAVASSALPAAPAKPPAERVERKKELPVPRVTEAPALDFRRIKKRKLLQLLKAHGINLDAGRRRSTGHQPYVGEDGTRYTIPSGSKHDILRPKTFKSLANRVDSKEG